MSETAAVPPGSVNEHADLPGDVRPEPEEKSLRGFFSRIQLFGGTDQLVIVAICVILLGWATIRWVEYSRWGAAELEIQRLPQQQYAYQVDLNSGTWIEFALLDGIGEVLGKKIVADREVNGPFTSVEQLQRVKGIGAKKLARIQSQLVVDSPAFANEKTP